MNARSDIASTHNSIVFLAGFYWLVVAGIWLIVARMLEYDWVKARSHYTWIDVSNERRKKEALYVWWKAEITAYTKKFLCKATHSSCCLVYLHWKKSHHSSENKIVQNYNSFFQFFKNTGFWWNFETVEFSGDNR